MGQFVLSAVGAVIGAVIGYFTGDYEAAYEGAEIGWMAGGVAGSLIFRQKGPSPNDIRVQDSAYGKPIPFVYGLYRLAGNIIWAGQPYIEDSGKGGGSKGSQQQKVAMSFAVGLCAGPILGLRRIWANGQLIYDVTNPSNFQTISGSSQMVTNFKVYLGNETQTADPTMQAALGASNVPAYRGLAYVVFNDLDLSTWGNYLPSMSFEVMQDATPVYTRTGMKNVDVNPALTISTYSYITSMDEAGNCLGWQWADTSGSYIGMIPFKLTQYGTQWTGLQYNNFFDFMCENVQDWDGEGGILDSNGNWLLPLLANGNPALSVTGIIYGAAGSSNCSAIKKNGIIYGSCYLGGSAFPILISQPGLPVAQQGNFSAAMKLLGVSSTHIYLMGVNPPSSDPTYGGKLIQADLSGNFVAFLDTNSHVYGQLTCGSLVSDNEIYINSPDAFLYMWNGSALVTTTIPASPTPQTNFFRVVNQNMALYASMQPSPAHFFAEVTTYNPADCTVASIVSDICERAGMLTSEFDTTQLLDIVDGFSCTNHSVARANLNPLMALYFFDACDTDGKLRFIRRGSQPVGTFLYSDLGASSSVGDTQNTNPISEIIAQEVDLPRSLSLTYPMLHSDYNPGNQRALRAQTNSNKDLGLQVPIVMSDDEALLRVQASLWSSWIKRKSFSFATPLSYLQYEPGDVMTLQGANGLSYTVMITRCQYDGQGALLWSASLEQPNIYPPLPGSGSSYSVQGGQSQGFRTQSIDYSGPTQLVVMDIPPLQNSDGGPGLYLAACGLASNWPGAGVELSRDDTTFTQAAILNRASTIGYAATALPAFMGGNQPDELSTVSVVLYNGTLAGCTYAEFLAGVNAAYIGGEVIFFRNATQTGANTYTLSGLLRARAGTDYATTTHAINDPFVLLDATKVLPININATDIGTNLYFEAFLLNIFNKNVSGSATVAPSNARIKPHKPHLFTAGHGSSGSTSDITLSWIRAARINYGWFSGSDVPLDESAENYTLTIYSGATLKRTVTVAGTGDGATYVYTAANITADGFSTGNTITFDVQQNSDQGVLGTAAVTTITR